VTRSICRGAPQNSGGRLRVSLSARFAASAAWRGEYRYGISINSNRDRAPTTPPSHFAAQGRAYRTDLRMAKHGRRGMWLGKRRGEGRVNKRKGSKKRNKGIMFGMRSDARGVCALMLRCACA